MRALPLSIPEVLLIQPEIFEDARGFFFESFNLQRFNRLIGKNYNFVQDNQSRSKLGVLRGLHYQIKKPQGKLVRVTRGAIFDVAVDLRSSSTTFGQWTAAELSDANQKQLWIPPGFAHGFVAISEIADVLYKTTDYYAPEYERTIAWNDKKLAIDWQYHEEPQLSPKDLAANTFAQAEVFP